MGDQHSHSMWGWFGDWLRARTDHAEATDGELTWSEVHDEFGPDGCGLLHVLVTIAHGRRVFSADPRDVLALLDMTDDRFGELVLEFVRRNVLRLEMRADDAEWTLLREPPQG